MENSWLEPPQDLLADRAVDSNGLHFNVNPCSASEFLPDVLFTPRLPVRTHAAIC